MQGTSPAHHYPDSQRAPEAAPPAQPAVNCVKPATGLLAGQHPENQPETQMPKKYPQMW